MTQTMNDRKEALKAPLSMMGPPPRTSDQGPVTGLKSQGFRHTSKTYSTPRTTQCPSLSDSGF